MSKFVGILSDSEAGELQQVIKDEFEQVDKKDENTGLKMEN